MRDERYILDAKGLYPGPYSMLMLPSGEWKRIPVPWKDSTPDEWFNENTGDRVWSSDPNASDPDEAPRVDIYEVLGTGHPAETGYRLAAVFVNNRFGWHFSPTPFVLLAGLTALTKFTDDIAGFIRRPRRRRRKPRTVPLDSVPEPSYEDADPDD
jgi:hypothetical protein